MICCVQIEMTVFIVSAAFLSSEQNWHQNGLGIGWMAIVWATLGVVSIFWLINLHLILLHVFLICKDMTTYEWIFNLNEKSSPLKQ